MKLKSRTGEPVQVCLLSSHCIVVYPEGTEVPEMFLSEAFRLGCIPVEVKTDEAKDFEPDQTGKSRDEIIADAIKLMLERGDEMTGTGMPHLKSLSKEVGFSVDKEEMVRVFGQLAQEAGEE